MRLRALDSTEFLIRASPSARFGVGCCCKFRDKNGWIGLGESGTGMRSEVGTTSSPANYDLRIHDALQIFNPVPLIICQCLDSLDPQQILCGYEASGCPRTRAGLHREGEVGRTGLGKHDGDLLEEGGRGRWDERTNK